MRLDIINTTQGPAPVSPLKLKKWLSSEFALRRRADNYFIEVYWVGESKIRQLNRRYRGEDRVADVLSFPVEIRDIRQSPSKPLGTIVLCLPVVTKQAARNGTTVEQETELLVRHSAKHLIGIHHKE